MNTALVRLAAFVVGLAVVFAGGLAVGSAVGPEVGPVGGHDGPDGHGTSDHGASDHGPGSGKQVSLELDRSRVVAGPRRLVTFRLLGADGAPLASYDEKHERDLHLIVVGTPGLTDYQHLHPTRDGDRWAARMALAPGRHRVYADGRHRRRGLRRAVVADGARAPYDREPHAPAEHPRPRRTVRRHAGRRGRRHDDAPGHPRR